MIFSTKLFALFGVLAGLLGIGTITQINGISSAVQNFFDPQTANVAFTIGGTGYSWTVVITGLIVTAAAAFVIIGGIKRIAKVSEVIVPFMAVMYVVFALVLIGCNVTRIPAAIVEVVQGAFGLKAAAGGALGAMIVVAQKGVARGIFSNEAGLGSAPIAAAAAKTKDTVRQGLVTMTGTFIDTVIICTMTGLSIVIAGSWAKEGLAGVGITMDAFQSGLSFLPGTIPAFILMICLVFFAFTTILGWDYYSERCLEYLSNRNMTVVKIYRWVYVAAVFIGPYLTVSAVWTIADIFNGLMAIPNIIALLALSGVIAKETNEYFKNKKYLPHKYGKQKRLLCSPF
ncbi:MAG: amino acid carrier protein [Clostridia bacterium]|nr:amino acid carrier protein [Clostridia bacterium]